MMARRALRGLWLVTLLLAGCGEWGDGSRSESARAVTAAGADDFEAGESRRVISALENLAYARGAPSAPQVVYEFSDFACRYCAEFAADILPRLLNDPAAAGTQWHFVPVSVGFPNGAEAAWAAICAGDQGVFWEMHDLLFDTQRRWTAANDPEPHLVDLAARAGAETGRFTACFHDPDTRSRHQRANRVALLFGVRATPSFFVSGRLVEGAIPAERFRELLVPVRRDPDESE